MTSRDRKLRVWLQKQEQLVLRTPDKQEQAYLLGMWLGFLNGMKLTNAITMQKYNRLYTALWEFTENVEQKGEKLGDISHKKLI